MVRVSRRADIEIHLHPRNPRGRIRSLRMRPARARWLVFGTAMVLGVLLVGLALAPKAWAIRGSHRDYRASVALRRQLGDRMQLLVDGLNVLGEQSRRLSARVARVERIYGLLDGAAELEAGMQRPGDSVAAGTPDPTGLAGLSPPASSLLRIEGVQSSTIFARLIEEGNAVERQIRTRLDSIDRAVAAVAAADARSPELARSVPARSPASGDSVVLSSGFGTRRSPFTRELEFHAGLDFAAPRGTPVVAPARGIVAWTGAVVASRRNDWWRLGRTVVLRHGDGYRTLFGHLDEIVVRPGMRVEAGARLGTVGESGWTTAPHLHYEIRRAADREWVAVDPHDYLLDRIDPDRARPTGRETDGLVAPPLPPEFRR